MTKASRTTHHAPPATPFLPYGRQVIEEDDISAVVEVLRGDYLTTGPAVAQFEQALGDLLRTPFTVACANGTAALHMAALALELGPGDAVIVPAVTFLATANAARFVGADVVFADVNPETGLMEAQHLEAALTRIPDGQTAKAVFPVHLNGQCCNMEAIAQVARAHDLKIVEDACHALGARYTYTRTQGMVGDSRFSDMCTFSFHPVKTIAMGEGGAVTTQDPVLLASLNRIRNHGMTRNPEQFTDKDQAFDTDGAPNPWYYEMHEPGYNYRASDIHCALGTSQLGKISRFARVRKQLVTRYTQALSDMAPLITPIAHESHCSPVWHLYPALIDFKAMGLTRAQLMNRLRENGIGTQVHYLPLHQQPYYRERYGVQSLPGAEAYYAHCLSLPLFAAMTEEDVDKVVNALKSCIEPLELSTESQPAMAE